MAKIIWTSEALYWVQEIFEYISQDNKDAAARTVEGIHGKVELLKNFPELGAIYPEVNTKNVRMVLYGHYRIAYRLNTAQDVEVLGVFHASLDIDKLL